MNYKLLFITFVLYAFWIPSQTFLSTDIRTENKIIDRIHDSETFVYILNYLEENSHVARFNIALTTFLIDITIFSVMAWSILYNYPRPVVLFFIGITLRQVCQFINRLPIPDRIIWYDPGFPTLFMVYAAENDFFFSGHTLTALIFGLELFDSKYLSAKIYGIFFIIYQIFFVMVTRTHYFMDVYAATATYFMISYFYEKSLKNILE